jgi:DNA-binding NtrC family response regulator
MLSECLRASGYEVDSAYDGVEGIGMLRFKKYHLLLLDIRMPRKDGLEVLKFVKGEYPDIKVIIVTGLASMDEVKETVKMGAFACIKKPFRIDKILEKVSQALTPEGRRPGDRGLER